MYKQQKVREVFTFRHFSRTPYALFRVLGREVRVGVLSVATLSVAAPCLSQTAAKPLSDIRQAADTVVLGDAWVVASPSVTRLADAAAVQTQVLTREDLAAAGVTSINDALKLATGIDVRQRGGFGMQTDISIDGGTFDQIAFFVNGFPLNNPQTGHNAADLPVNLSDIVRIEILEGAAASVFGSQAFSGAVNVITKAPSKSPPAGGDLEGAFVITFTAPLKAWEPNTLAAAPSRISMRTMSERFTGRSAALWPVCGLLRGNPLTKNAIWSKVPPSMLMSVCIPKPPRCRTSMPVASFNASLILVTPAAARSSRVSTCVCTAAASASRVTEGEATTHASPSTTVSAA